MTIVTLIVWLLILGFVAWLVSISPITEPTFKKFIIYALIVVGAFILISFVIHSTGTAALGTGTL